MLRVLALIMVIFCLPVQGNTQPFSFESAVNKQNAGRFLESLQEASHIKTAEKYLSELE